MVRWLRSLFAWKLVRRTAAWDYSVNAITGQHRADRRVQGGYSPVDLGWLVNGSGHPLINGMPAWRSAEGQIDGRIG